MLKVKLFTESSGAAGAAAEFWRPDCKAGAGGGSRSPPLWT